MIRSDHLSALYRSALLPTAVAAALLLPTLGSADAQYPYGWQAPPGERMAQQRPSSRRLARLTCEALNAQRDGLTDASWLALAGFPLAEITVDEAQALRAFVQSCLQPGVPYPVQRGLRQVLTQTSFILGNAQRRVADTQRRDERRRDQEAQAADVVRLAKEIEAASQRQAARPPEEHCKPGPYDVLGSLTERYPSDVRSQVRDRPEYKAFEAACNERTRRIAEAESRRWNEQREQDEAARRENPNHDHMHIIEYASEARDSHAGRISQTGLPSALIDAPINMPIDAPSALYLNLFDTRQLTLGQWFGMLIEIEPKTEIGGSRDRWRGGWWFTIKFPGERTIAFGVEQDGSDWFVTKVRHGDTEQAVSQNELAQLGSVLALRAGLMKVATQGGRRSRQ